MLNISWKIRWQNIGCTVWAFWNHALFLQWNCLYDSFRKFGRCWRFLSSQYCVHFTDMQAAFKKHAQSETRLCSRSIAHLEKAECMYNYRSTCWKIVHHRQGVKRNDFRYMACGRTNDPTLPNGYHAWIPKNRGQSPCVSVKPYIFNLPTS